MGTSRLKIISEENWWKTGETEMHGTKPVQLPLCPSQITHRLTWNRTQATVKQTRATRRLSHHTAYEPHIPATKQNRTVYLRCDWI